MTTFTAPLDSDPQALYGYVVEKLAPLGLAFLHVIEGETGGTRTPEGKTAIVPISALAAESQAMIPKTDATASAAPAQPARPVAPTAIQRAGGALRTRAGTGPCAGSSATGDRRSVRR